jgi:hypothetical protein
LCFKAIFVQAVIEKFCRTPLICLVEKSSIGINILNFAVLDSLRYSVDMVYIIMAYDDPVDFIYSAVVQKGRNGSSANIAVVHRARIKQNIDLARKLYKYCLPVADIKARDD